MAKAAEAEKEETGQAGNQAAQARYPAVEEGAVEAFEARIRELAGTLQIEEAEKLAGQLADQGLSLAWGVLADAFFGAGAPLRDESRWLELKGRHALAGGLLAGQAALEIARVYQETAREGESIAWLQRAAGLGCEEAAIALGFAYADGVGLEADPLEAVRWFLRSLRLPPADPPVADAANWPVVRGIGWRDWELYRRLMRHASPAQRVAMTDLIIPSEYVGEAAEAAAQRVASSVSVKHAEARWVRVANIGCVIALVVLIGAVLRLAGMHDVYGVVTCLLLMVLPLLTLAALNL